MPPATGNRQPATGGEEDAIPGGNKSQCLRRPGLFPIALDCVLEYLLGNPRLQPATNEYYHAACYGAFIAGSTIELRKLLVAACVTDGITPAFGQRLEAVVHSMEAIDDGHGFRLAYLRKHLDTQMHHGDNFALDVVRERYFRPGTENTGSPKFSELLELYKDRVYDTTIASAAKTSARQRFGAAFRRNDRDRDGGRGSRENFKTTTKILTHFIADAEGEYGLTPGFTKGALNADSSS
eukprot:jgi/Tetstr1/438186/TSEL_026786.t1